MENEAILSMMKLEHHGSKNPRGTKYPRDQNFLVSVLSQFLPCYLKQLLRTQHYQTNDLNGCEKSEQQNDKIVHSKWAWFFLYFPSFMTGTGTYQWTNFKSHQ